MRFPLRRQLKKELSARLIYSPFLRLVLFNTWFRAAVICFAALLVFLGLFLPRIWRVTPRGFMPIVKVSGLDIAQAWSLKRSALRAMEAGDFDAAAYAWQAAVANNPANAALVRGALRNVLQLERPAPKYQGQAVGQAMWLLRLNGTNVVDVELASQVFDRFELYDLVLRLLGQFEKHLTAPEEVVYLKALFHSGQMSRFARRWEESGQANITPETQLYHAAYLAGWGPPSEARAGRRRLEAALEDPKQRILANRLRLLVCAHSSDAAGYHESLERLEQWQSDALLEHVIYWRLLATLGRKEEARALLRAYPRPPASVSEVTRLVETSVALDMREEAGQLLRRNIRQFGSSPELWVLQANLLIDDRKWEELRETALQIRQYPAVQDSLAGYSYYLEGRAELGLDRIATAEEAFEKAARRPSEDRALGLATGEALLKLGYPAVARDILMPLQTALAGSAGYWQILFAAAYELKQQELMATAAARAYALQPGSVACANNYAAALLVNREHADEAVSLTLQLSERFPDSAAAKINHGLALLLNRRIQEAEALFNAIDAARLSPLERTSLSLGLFEVYFAEQEYDKAREVSERINMKYLFPNQVAWLETERRQMPERQAAK